MCQMVRKGDQLPIDLLLATNQDVLGRFLLASILQYLHNLFICLFNTYMFSPFNISFNTITIQYIQLNGSRREKECGYGPNLSALFDYSNLLSLECKFR